MPEDPTHAASLSRSRWETTTPPESGLLLLTPKGGDFSDDSRELAYWLASQAWTALENARLHGRLQQEVVTDGLTELPNRRGFQQALETEVRRAERLNGDLGLIVADLDGFKSVNDRHGHLAGDDVLRCVRRGAAGDRSRDRRRRPLRGRGVRSPSPRDRHSRVPSWSPNGFARAWSTGRSGAMPGSSSRSPPASGSRRSRLVDEDELFGAADQALYAAKEAGKNCVAVAGERVTVRPEP